MGRIDDPSQLQNSVNPTVQPSNAEHGDYDNDGDVDDADYSTWRASFGATGHRLPADGNLDGVVDAADYTIWRDNLGRVFAPATLIQDVSARETVLAAQPAAAVTEGNAVLPFFSWHPLPTTSLKETRSPLASPLASFPDDDLLLLALTPSLPAATESPVPTQLPADSSASSDEVFTELGTAVDGWERAKWGM
jgi:hypothetical protein